MPLPRLFDYRSSGQSAPVGCRVKVSFAGRQLTGVVVDHTGQSEVPADKLKPVDEVLDSAPIMEDHLLSMGRWLSDYYLHPHGETLATMLPAALRRGQPAAVRGTSVWHLTTSGAKVTQADVKRAIRQWQALEMLADGPQLHGTMIASPGIDRKVLTRLAELGWVVETDRPDAPITRDSGLDLNLDQSQAVEAIITATGFESFLLHGVTGSGKTEVYLAAIAPRIAAGKQVLVLVPEIALTPQLIRRFTRRFGHQVEALHSALTDSERLGVWVRARRGDCKVVVGTRSALFTPLPDLDLIVVDEEHDGSFKQGDGLRYHARDCAVWRARAANVPIVLGSATPSLESLHNQQSGRYRLLSLPKRAGAARPPDVRIVDLRADQATDGMSRVAMDRIRAELAAGRQVMVFLNRRGFAPVVMCDACGWFGECPRCDTRLTLHRAAHELRCHHCGFHRHMPRSCPQCGSARLKPLGIGTERLHQHIQSTLNDARVIRFDRDAIRNHKDLNRALDQMRDGKPAVLLGTQMLAKGHDFPNVTLAIVVDLDGTLFSGDFRAAENAAQLLLQVGGRAGRAEHRGEMLLQTHHPEHPLFKMVLTHGYIAYAQVLLAERRAAGFPPYGHLLLVRAEGQQEQPLQVFLDQAVDAFPVHDGVDIFGPLPSPMARRAGWHRKQVLLSAPARSDLRRIARPWIDQLRKLPSGRKVRWSVDVDPMDGV